MAGPLEHTSMEDFQQQMNVNFFGAVSVSKVHGGPILQIFQQCLSVEKQERLLGFQLLYLGMASSVSNIWLDIEAPHHKRLIILGLEGPIRGYSLPLEQIA